MTYEPYSGAARDPVSMFVGPYSREGAVLNPNAPVLPASTTWPTAQQASYHQVVVPRPCVVRRYWWVNGATVGTDNIQVGLYDENWNAVKLGTSTLSAGASAIQFDDIADTPIAAGRYWLAMWMSGTTATVLRVNGTVVRPSARFLQAGLTTGLPATATPAQDALGNIPLFGFTTRATP